MIPLDEHWEHWLLLQCRYWVCVGERGAGRGLGEASCRPNCTALPRRKAMCSSSRELLLCSLCLSVIAPSSLPKLSFSCSPLNTAVSQSVFFNPLFNYRYMFEWFHLYTNFGYHLYAHDSQICFFSPTLFLSSRLPTGHFFSTVSQLNKIQHAVSCCQELD